MLKHILPLLFLAVLVVSCISNQRTTGSNLVNAPKTNSISDEDVRNPTDLTVYLQRISGVTITGCGAAAQIRIRGPIL